MTICYVLGEQLYVNLTNRCTNRCCFMEKGIDGDTINACLEEQDAEAMQKLQLRQIQQLAQKKNHGQKPSDQRESAKVIQYLLRKGYPMSLIKAALSDELLEDLYK